MCKWALPALLCIVACNGLEAPVQPAEAAAVATVSAPSNKAPPTGCANPAALYTITYTELAGGTCGAITAATNVGYPSNGHVPCPAGATVRNSANKFTCTLEMDTKCTLYGKLSVLITGQLNWATGAGRAVGIENRRAVDITGTLCESSYVVEWQQIN